MKTQIKRRLQIVLGLSLLSVIAMGSADGDLTQQKPITITVQLGDSKNRLRFFPRQLNLQTSKLYRLVLHNPSSIKHYFTSPQLAARVFTRKVQINHPNKTAMVEVKGIVREIEVYPGYSAEWWFVPIRSGKITDLHCSIKGHRAGGMTGVITIH